MFKIYSFLISFSIVTITNIHADKDIDISKLDKFEIFNKNTTIKKNKIIRSNNKNNLKEDTRIFDDTIQETSIIKKENLKQHTHNKKLRKNIREKNYTTNLKDNIYIFDDNIKKEVKEKKNNRIATIKKIVTEEVIQLKEKVNDNSFDITKIVTKVKKITPKNKFTAKDGLTLKQAIIKAVSRNEKIISLQQKVIQAKRIVDQKYAGLFPMINIIANTGPNEIKTEKELEKGRFSKGDMQISLTQNLYAGGKTTNDIKMVKENLNVALAKYQQNLEKEILNIIDSYLNLVYEKKSIEQNRENIINLNKILNIVTIKEKNGAATKGDLNYIKSNIENVKSQLILAESKYKNSISYYEYFVGNISENNYPIEENFNISVNQNASIEKLVSKNPKLLEIKANMVKYKYDLESKKARFKPTLDLILTDKYTESSDEGVASTDKKTAVLSLNYALYNGGRDKAILFEAKSKVDEYKYKYLDKKKSLLYNAIQIYNNLNSSGKSLKHIEKEVDANTKVVKSYWTSFKYGNQDLQALLLAQRALNSSKLNKIENRKTYISQYFQLLSSVGSLLKYMGLQNIVNTKSIRQKAKLSILRSNLND